MVLRRRTFIAVCLGATGAAVVARSCENADAPEWTGAVLSRGEAAVIAAAALALVPDEPGGEWPEGPTPLEVAHNVDEYLTGMPPALRRDVHALLLAVEQLTPLAGQWRRFSRLDATTRLDALVAISETRPGALIYRGLRDLVMLGFYQDQRAWADLEYEGPLVGECRPGRWDVLARGSRYDHLIAPPAALPGRTQR